MTAVLRAGGGTPRDLVKVTFYVRDKRDYRERAGTGAEFERIVARPSDERERIKQALRERFRDPRLTRGRRRAQSVYAAIAGRGA